jgi:2-oxoglutarate ferredoxin oxidoreductase subunit beta
LEKAFEWGDRIPIGIFYNKERPTYHDNLPHVKDVPLTKAPTENVDITSTLNEMM